MEKSELNKYPLIMTNSSPWFLDGPFIEIDGLPINNGGSFHGYVKEQEIRGYIVLSGYQLRGFGQHKQILNQNICGFNMIFCAKYLVT